MCVASGLIIMVAAGSACLTEIPSLGNFGCLAASFHFPSFPLAFLQVTRQETEVVVVLVSKNGGTVQ